MAYPHVFVDGPGNTASGEEVMDNLDYLLAKITANAEPLGTVTTNDRFGLVTVDGDDYHGNIDVNYH